MSRWMSDSMFADITVDILGKWPNTYTFTKAIAERLLLDEKGHVPAVIFRPSIVTASLKEPMSVSFSFFVIINHHYYFYYGIRILFSILCSFFTRNSM